MRTRVASLFGAVAALLVMHPQLVLTQGTTTAMGPGAAVVATTYIADAPSVAYGISRTGEVVGSMRHAYFAGDAAFRWTAATGLMTFAEGVSFRVNSSGLIAGRTDWMGSIPGARVWTPSGAEFALSTGEALDVNERGQVVGWTWLLETLLSQAFIWDEGDGWVRLGTLLGTHQYYDGSSELRGINDHGVAAGWSITVEGRPHAVRWSAAAGFVDLAPGSALYSAANAINNLGVAVGVVGSYRDHALAVQWDRDGVESVLDAVWGSQAWPTAVNDLGQVVGRFLVNGVQHAFFWDPENGWLDLGPGAAHDINESGTIVGSEGTGYPQQAVAWHLAPALQVAALRRTLDTLTGEAPALNAARAQVRQAERLLSRGDAARAAERLERAAEAVLRVERHAPGLGPVLRSLATASQQLARAVGT
jgi:probable HAF family extracellular repeat protein